MMAADGLAKLIEECGELQQVCGKRLAYFTTDEHVDDAGLYTEEEAARIERIRGTDIAVPADVVREAAVRVVPSGAVAQYNEPTLAKRHGGS